MASTNKSASSVHHPWLQKLMKQKAEQILTEWQQQFRQLDEDRNPQNLTTPHAIAGSIVMAPKKFNETKKETFTNKLWTVDDHLSKQKFFISRGPKTNEMTDFYATFTKLGVSAVVSFYRLHEGPMGPRGAADFNDALYFPCTPGEIAHFVIVVGDTSAEVVVTNTRVTMINDVVAVSDLDVDVNVNIAAPVLGSCHTIEPRRCSMLQHLQHFNWPPDEPPWCTDSVLQTLATLHRLYMANENREKQMTTLLLCGDGCIRSGAFVALSYCVIRASSLEKPFDLQPIVKESVEFVRAQCPDAMRNERIYVWLNYAIIELCVKRLVETAAVEKKKSKKACEWLAKLRKIVYGGEKKSALGSLMG